MTTLRADEQIEAWGRLIRLAIAYRLRELDMQEWIDRVPHTREREMLTDYQESLADPQGLLEMWLDRENVERLVRFTPSEESK